MVTSQQPRPTGATPPGGEPELRPLPHLTVCLAITAISALVTLALLFLT